MVDADLGNKRPSTITIEIWEQEFMLKGEVYIGLIPTTIPPITKENVVYF